MTAPTSRFTYMLAECFPDTDFQMAPSDKLANHSDDGAAAAQHAAARALAAQTSGLPDIMLSLQIPTGKEPTSVLPPAQQLPLHSNSPLLAIGQSQTNSIPSVQTDVLSVLSAQPDPTQPGVQGRLASPSLHDPMSEPRSSTDPAPLLSTDVDDGTILELSLDNPALLTTTAPESLEAAVSNMTAITGQQAAEAQFPGAQQLSQGRPGTNESLLHGNATPNLGLSTSSPILSMGQQPVDPQDGLQEPAAGSAGSMQLAETVQASAAVQGAAEPGSLPPHQEVEVKDEADIVMEEADKRSAADIFEQTVIDCETVLSDLSSVLLDEAAPDASGTSKSRIAASERASMWQKELQGLLNRCKIPQLYIGVLGDTGAGKSSTINCLLGEENVLPVNGMRACTACVVEISYISSSVYEGTVECMTRDEWTAQAKSLWGDLIDERGRLKICRDVERRLNTSSIEGAAQATLETVYGPNNLRRAGMTLERLLEVNNKITALLGRTISIREHAVKQFRKRIGEYADSHNKKDEIQAWPLVKVCKLKHNWQLLSTGAVVVDLPGVRDANAARGAVAEKYMKTCNAVWIVADITRAVDNRTAKDLLGENFRRQMLMDGQYGSITFICTKTDVIQVSETVRAFSQGGGSGRVRMCEAAGVPIERYEQAQQRVDEKQDELNKVEGIVKRCKKKAKPLVRAITGLKTRLQNCRAKVARVQSGGVIAPQSAAAAESDSDFEADCSSGSDSDGAYAPGDKRKSKRTKGSRSKRRRKSLSGSDSDVGLDLFSSEDDDGSDDSDEQEEVDMPAKATDQAPTALPELQAQAVELQAELDEKTAIVQTLKKEEKEAQALADKLERQLKKVQLVVSDICGRARNSYSKGVLKKDFKDGLLEMEETAANVDLDAGGDAAGSASQQRQPSKVTDEELPVFCVSAKDCQRLEGRTSKDGPPSAFTKLDHTELPQLRAHVHHVTEQGRLHGARSVASGLAHFINTTAMTLVHHATINAQLQDACHAAFKTELAKLQVAAKELLASWKFMLEHDCTQGSISPRLLSGAEAAENRAVSTQAKWGAHKKDGGYYWATYKATVRPARNGVYKSGACGEINFNADLAKPILDGISMQWETLFGSTIIDRLKSYRNTMLRHVAEFLAAVMASLAKLGVDESRLQHITQEVQAHEVRKSTDLLAKVAEDIQARQRDMSRDIIEPTVQNSMTDGYAACCAEVGSGQFERMRRLMRATVEHQKGSMFTEGAGKLEAAMKAMVVTVAKHLEKAQQSLAARIADTFTILWERPMCSITERRAALVSLQGLAGQMQGVCKGAGAPVLQLVLPEEEEEDAQQNMNPDDIRLKPKQEDEDMEEYDDNEEAEEVHEDDMGDDDDEEEDDEEAQDGLPFISPYHVINEEEEDEEEEGAEGLFGVDDDASEVEVTPGEAWNQFQGTLGSRSSANRAKHMELAGRDALNPGMIMLQPAAAAGGSARRGPTPAPFHTPRPFVKSEPSATPHDSAGHMGGAGQGSAQLGQPCSHCRRQLQTSSGFKNAARQSLEQRSKTEGARPCPADAFAQVASLFQSAGHGLSLSRPPPRSFPGIDSTVRGLRTELERTDKGTHAQAAEQSSLAEDEEQQDTHSVAAQVMCKPADARMQGLESASLLSAEMPPVSDTDPTSVDTEASGAAAQGSAKVLSPSADPDELQSSKALAGNGQADAVVAGSVSVAEVQREAAFAAAKDAQGAEQFAAQALQSPQLQSSPGSKAHGLPGSDAQHDVKPAAAAEEWIEQGLAADMMQSGTPAVTANGQQKGISGSATEAAREATSKADNASSSILEATSEIVPTPAGPGVVSKAERPSTGAKSGARSAWFGKAGGLLNRWAVPVKVKKEPKSTSKHGIADVIDLT
ncbi:TPA: hypothetical protein ACH3X1_011148 [Trebouxia sp. C0004]